MRPELYLALDAESRNYFFGPLAYVCPTCRSVYCTKDEATDCRASHPPETPPANEDR